MNESRLDRSVRTVAGIVLVLLAALVTHGALSIVLWILGGILLVTAVVGFCPLYYLFHLSTRKE